MRSPHQSNHQTAIAYSSGIKVQRSDCSEITNVEVVEIEIIVKRNSS